MHARPQTRSRVCATPRGIRTTASRVHSLLDSEAPAGVIPAFPHQRRLLQPPVAPCQPGQTSLCCGDRTCDGPETPDNCAADCATSSIDAAQLQGSGSGLGSGGLGVQPLVQSATAGSGAALAGGGAAAAEDGKPCEYAELRFGTGRACADYVTGQLHYASRAVGTLTAEIVVAIPVFGCEPLANAPAVVGKLVLVERGTCDFVDKAANAVAAGAVAVVIINVSTPSGPISLTRVRGLQIART